MSTPCAGKSELFDSTRADDHAEAKRLCRECPVINECAALLRDVQKAATGGPAGYPTGTWAGRLLGEVTTRKRAACGTDSGYYHHRRRGEQACDPCLKARAEAEARRYARKKARAS